MAKELNRNAFNEKLIHRYLIENYYFANKSARNRLLPEAFHQMEINLIVPEESNESDKAYRADLSLYFKNSDKRIPVEVKWSASGLTKYNQIKHLKENNGFVASFQSNVEIGDIPSVVIKYEDFKDWVASNISKLIRESITEKTSGESTRINQTWLVFLRGEKAKKNFQKMLRKSPNAPFWAFRQDRTALSNILNIQKGDTCVFLFGKGLKQGQGYSDAPEKELLIDQVYVGKVTKPYYMVLDNEKGTFFESDKKLPINQRTWPHFIDFKIQKIFSGKKTITYGKQGKLGSALAKSTNFGGGTPVSLTQSEYEGLMDKLRLLADK